MFHAYGEVATPPSYCTGWASAAQEQSQASDGSNLVSLVSLPGPFLSGITEDLYAITASSGYAAAVAQLRCFAQYVATQLGGTEADWMAKWAPMLALVKPKVVAGSVSQFATRRAVAPQPATRPAGDEVQMIGEPAGGIPWVYIGAGAVVLGGLAYYLLVMRKGA